MTESNKCFSVVLDDNMEQQPQMAAWKFRLHIKKNLLTRKAVWPTDRLQMSISGGFQHLAMPWLMQSSNSDSSALSRRLDEITSGGRIILTSRGPVQPAFLSNTSIFSYSFSKNKEHCCKKFAVMLNVLLDSQTHTFIFLNNQNSDAIGGWWFCLLFFRTMTILSPLPLD